MQRAPDPPYVTESRGGLGHGEWWPHPMWPARPCFKIYGPFGVIAGRIVQTALDHVSDWCRRLLKIVSVVQMTSDNPMSAVLCTRAVIPHEVVHGTSESDKAVCLVEMSPKPRLARRQNRTDSFQGWWQGRLWFGWLVSPPLSAASLVAAPSGKSIGVWAQASNPSGILLPGLVTAADIPGRHLECQCRFENTGTVRLAINGVFTRRTTSQSVSAGSCSIVRDGPGPTAGSHAER